MDENQNMQNQPVETVDVTEENIIDRSQNVNVMAIVSFVMAFLFNIVGLILGFVALKQIKSTGEKGRGLAISGIVISIVSILLSFLILYWVTTGVISLFNSATEESSQQEEETVPEEGVIAEPVELDIFTRAGDLKVKANAINEFEGSEVFKPAAGNYYLNVELEIVNEGFETKYVSPLLQMYVKDGAGNTYRSDLLAMPDGSDDLEGEIASKRTVIGLVGFEIASSATDLELYVEDGSLTNTNIARIDFGR